MSPMHVRTVPAEPVQCYHRIMDSSSVPQTGNDGSEPSGSSKYGHVSPLATNEDKGNWKEDRRSTRLVLAIQYRMSPVSLVIAPIYGAGSIR